MKDDKLKQALSGRLAAATGIVVIGAIISLALGGWSFARLNGHVRALNGLLVAEAQLASVGAVISDLEISGFLAADGDLEQADLLSESALAMHKLSEENLSGSTTPGATATLSELGELVAAAAAANADVRAAVRAKKNGDGSGNSDGSTGHMGDSLNQLLDVRRAADLRITNLTKTVIQNSRAAEAEQGWAQRLGGTAFVSGGLLLALGLVLGVVLHRTVSMQHQSLTLMNTEVQEKTEFLQSILDSLDANICILKEDGSIVDVNKSWNEFRDVNEGRMANAGIGSNYFEACSRVQGESRKFAGNVATSIKHVIDGREDSFVSEYDCHGSDEKRWFQIRATPLQASKFSGAVVAHIDITQRVEALERLRAKTAEAEKLAHVARSTDNAVMIVDSEQRIEWVNEAFQQVTGVAPQVALGCNAREFLNRNVEDIRQSAALQEAFTHNSSADAELRFEIEGGVIQFSELELRPIRCSESDSAAKFIAVARDVTRRREAEEERERVYQELVGTYQQAGKAATTLGVLHNVGNGLNSINVSATLLGEWIRDSSTRSLPRAADIIHSNSQDLANFLCDSSQGKHFPAYLQQLAKSTETERTNCLAELQELFGHIETVKKMVQVHHAYAHDTSLPSAIDVRVLFDDALATLSGSFERSNVEIVREYGEVPTVILQKEKLMQAVGNLLLNSLHAIRERAPSDPQLVMRVLVEGESVFVELADNGIGIDSVDIDRIFDHGFTTKENGNGLGLATSQKAVEELGGVLRVASKGRGEGATFTIELPVFSGGPEKCSSQSHVDAS